jgi:hypothetical protein
MPTRRHRLGGRRRLPLRRPCEWSRKVPERANVVRFGGGAKGPFGSPQITSCRLDWPRSTFPPGPLPCPPARPSQSRFGRSFRGASSNSVSGTGEELSARLRWHPNAPSRGVIVRQALARHLADGLQPRRGFVVTLRRIADKRESASKAPYVLPRAARMTILAATFILASPRWTRRVVDGGQSFGNPRDPSRLIGPEDGPPMRRASPR